MDIFKKRSPESAERNSPRAVVKLPQKQGPSQLVADSAQPLGGPITHSGHARIGPYTIVALALPFMANGAIQTVFNIIDMWFIGHISTKALAAVGSVQWLMTTIFMLMGSGYLVVQVIVAHAYGARVFTRAAKAVWTSLWGTLWLIPLLVVIAVSSGLILAPFRLDPQIEHLAAEFWFPRFIGAPLGLAGSAILGYFNGIGRPIITLSITAVAAVVNILFNQFFIFALSWGVAGSAWATSVAQAIALAIAMTIFLDKENRRRFKSHLTWTPRSRLIWRQLRLGLAFGSLPAVKILTLALFEVMQVQFDTIGGAATQLVVIIGLVAYIPGSGIAAAGMTLVGQSIGAGDSTRAMRIGTCVILLSGLSAGAIGLLFALAGPQVLSLLVSSDSEDTAAVIALGSQLLWLAVGYQFFDGVNIGCSMCLRAAGDANVPVALAVPIAWMVFLPLAHSLIFPPGAGWSGFLPQLGCGTIGGWVAMFIYMTLLASALFVRWYSRRWRKVAI